MFPYRGLGHNEAPLSLCGERGFWLSFDWFGAEGGGEDEGDDEGGSADEGDDVGFEAEGNEGDHSADEGEDSEYLFHFLAFRLGEVFPPSLCFNSIGGLTIVQVLSQVFRKTFGRVCRLGWVGCLPIGVVSL